MPILTEKHLLEMAKEGDTLIAGRPLIHLLMDLSEAQTDSVRLHRSNKAAVVMLTRIACATVKNRPALIREARAMLANAGEDDQRRLEAALAHEDEMRWRLLAAEEKIRALEENLAEYERAFGGPWETGELKMLTSMKDLEARFLVGGGVGAARKAGEKGRAQ